MLQKGCFFYTYIYIQYFIGEIFFHCSFIMLWPSLSVRDANNLLKHIIDLSYSNKVYTMARLVNDFLLQM